MFPAYVPIQHLLHGEPRVSGMPTPTISSRFFVFPSTCGALCDADRIEKKKLTGKRYLLPADFMKELRSNVILYNYEEDHE